MKKLILHIKKWYIRKSKKFDIAIFILGKNLKNYCKFVLTVYFILDINEKDK